MKKRDSNLELLRIISMCGIIIMHYFGLGGAVQNSTFPNFSWFFTHLLNSFTIPMVNCFVLITGYFLCTKCIFSLRKSLDMLVITAFYGMISYLCIIVKNGDVSLNGFLTAVFPFVIGKRWFVESYIILILLAPFINIIIRFLNKQQYTILLMIQLSLFCLWYSIGLSSPVLDDGYGIINFLTLYLIGGYIRNHGDDKFLCWNQKKYLGVFLICALTTFGLSYFINPYGYAFVTNIIGAVALFLFFFKWNLDVVPWINKISEVSFDVYFVHSDFNTSYWLFNEVLGAKFVIDSPRMIPHMLFAMVVIWILGYSMFKLRKQIFSRSIDRWMNKLAWINHEIEI